MKETHEPGQEKRTLLERFAESQNLVFFGVTIILIPLMMHTATLLLSVSVIKSNWYAYFFAVGFDLAIFIFAAHGRVAASGGIAFIVFLLNLSVLNLDTLNTRFDPLMVKFIVTLVLSGTAAWILHSYVIMFNEKKEERNDAVKWYDFKFQKEKEVGDLVLANQQLKDQVNALNESLQQIEIQRIVSEKSALVIEKKNEAEASFGFIQVGNNVVCKTCQQTFENESKYNSYKTRGLCQFKGCVPKNEDNRHLRVEKPITI